MGPWKLAVAGQPIRKDDVGYLRYWIPLSYRFGEAPHGVFPPLAFRTRAEEIVAAWDQWQTAQEAANEREDVAEAEARWKVALDNYHEIGRRVAAMPAKTMAGVMAKLLAAATELDENDLEGDADRAIAAGAALDAAALQAGTRGLRLASASQ